MNTLFRKLFAFVSLLRYIHAEITTFRCSSFDYSSNQDSATVSYATCNIFACPGDTVVASLCDDGSSCLGDPFLRLWDLLTMTEVAVNDDTCSVCSRIEHVIATETCQHFELREGCFANEFCSGRPIVTVTSANTPITNSPVAAPTTAPTILPTIVPTSTDSSSPTYVYVDTYEDNTTNLSTCRVKVNDNTTVSGCNLRSAYEYCVQRHALTVLDECIVVLPAANPTKSDIVVDTATNGPISIHNAIYNGTITLNGNNHTIKPLYIRNTGRLFEIQVVDGTTLGLFTVNIQDVSIDGFGMDDLNGGAIYINNTAGGGFVNVKFFNNIALNGGALHIQGTNELYLNHCEFLNNTAIDGSGAIFQDEFNYNMIINNTAFLKNIARNSAGAMGVFDSYNMMIVNSEFIENWCALYGGAIYFLDHNYHVTLANTRIIGNHAGYFGGGLRFRSYNEDFVCVNCSFLNNDASYGGGAYIKHYNNYMTYKDCIFENNTAIDGGAVYLDSYNPDLLFSNSTFRHNHATNNGGVLSIYSYNDVLDMENCIFVNNTALFNGGALYADYNNFFWAIRHCTFSQNVAIESGGAIHLNRYNYQISIQNSLFDSNHVNTLSGGAIYMHLSNSYTNIDSCVFKNNIAWNQIVLEGISPSSQGSLGGGAVFAHTMNHELTITDTLFDHNIAHLSSGGAIFLRSGHKKSTIIRCSFVDNYSFRSGGGINLMTFNTQFVMKNCYLSNNTAASDGGGSLFVLAYNSIMLKETTIVHNHGLFGGAIQITYGNTEITFLDCVIGDNFAISGAAVFLGMSNHDVSFFNSSILGNHATSEGGGVYVSRDTFVRFVDCHFEDNAALTDGGAIYYASDQLWLNGSYFNNNSAGLFGGSVFLTGHTMDIYECVFMSNMAGESSGGLYVYKAQEVTIDHNIFEKNSALINGGAISINEVEYVVVTHNQFLQNYAYDADTGGGGLHIMSSLSVEVDNNILINNTAVTGSGVWIAGSTVSLFENMLQSNVASGGGTIYWSVFSMNPPNTSEFRPNIFVNNSAVYGSTWATDGYSLSSDTGSSGNSSGKLEISEFIRNMDPLVVRLLDWYGQLVVVESGSIITMAVSEAASNCSSGVAALSGETIVHFERGIANFSQVVGHCTPNGNMTIHVFTSTHSLANNVLVSHSRELSFRSCKKGEYFEDNMCLRCPISFYSLVDNADLSVRECSACPEGATACEGDMITMDSGYWRISEYASTPVICPLAPGSCIGGTGVGDDLCGVGFGGPLCGHCVDGYYLDSSGFCTACGNQAPPIVVISLVGALIGCICIPLYNYIIAFTHWDDIPDMTDAEADPNKFLHEIYSYVGLTRYYNWYQLDTQYMRMSCKSIVHFTLFQIVGTLPFVLDVEFPTIFKQVFGKSTTLLNLNLPQLFGFRCTMDYDYVNYLVASTSGPVLLGCLIYFVGCIAILRIKWLHHVYEDQVHMSVHIESILAKCEAIFFYLVFIILPVTCTTIFRMFSCRDVDVDGVSDVHEEYLIADYSISCSSDRYFFGRNWAICAMFVYPIGIPCAMYWILYRKRVVIVNRFDEIDTIQEEKQRDLALLSVTFLVSSYKTEYYYWEVVESLRKIVFSGAIVMLGSGSTTQIVIAVVLSLGFVRVHNHFLPYEDAKVSLCAEIALWQLFAILYTILITKNTSLQKRVPYYIIDWTLTAFFFLNIVIDLSILSYLGYQFWRDARDQRFISNGSSKSRMLPRASLTLSKVQPIDVDETAVPVVDMLVSAFSEDEVGIKSDPNSDMLTSVPFEGVGSDGANIDAGGNSFLVLGSDMTSK